MSNVHDDQLSYSLGLYAPRNKAAVRKAERAVSLDRPMGQIDLASLSLNQPKADKPEAKQPQKADPDHPLAGNSGWHTRMARGIRPW